MADDNLHTPEGWHIVRLEAEIERLRAGLECIIRECSAMNKGPVAVHIAREALNEPPEEPGAETEKPAS